MHSFVLFLKYNGNLSNLMLLASVTSGFLVKLGKHTRSRMLGLDSLGYGHRVVELFATGLPMI